MSLLTPLLESYARCHVNHADDTTSTFPIFLDLSAPGSHFVGRANRKCGLCAAGRPVPTIAGPAREFLAAANEKLPSSRLPVIQLNWASRNLQRNP